MLSRFLIAFVLGALACELCAQDTGTRVGIPRSDLSKFLRNCSVKDEADVEKEIKRQADHAETVEKVLGLVILVITGDEGGKVEQEGIPALLKNLRTGAALTGYWDNLMSWWAGKSKTQAFDVCEPFPGTIVVKPLKGTLPLTPAGGLAGAPRHTYDDLFGQSRFATRCLAPSSARSFAKPPYITGRVVGTIEPSQWVSIAGPGYQHGCSTNFAGEFSFSGLPPGSYMLYIGSDLAGTFTVDANSDLTLGDLRVPFER